MKFLYMDETYPDFTLPRHAWSVALTGMVVPAARHREIRARYYSAISDAVRQEPSVIPPMPEIHAATLLPGTTNDTRIAFLEQLAAIIVEFDLHLYRIGYSRTRQMLDLFGSDKSILGLSFSGMLNIIEQELSECTVWPVMESDRSPEQDRNFAGHTQNHDYFAHNVGNQYMSRDATNFGETLYSTKRSIHGAITDCAAYLLNVRTIAALNLPLSPYKQRLNAVAERLAPVIRFDEIVTMLFERPPAGHIPSGPFRYAFPITPSDDLDL